MGGVASPMMSSTWVLSLLVCAMALPVLMARPVDAQTAPAPATTYLPVSPPEQPTGDFAHEWRRIGLLVAACGANEQYQTVIDTMIEALIQQKLATRKALGTEDADYVDRQVSRRNRLRASTRNCQAVGAPAYNITAEYTAYQERGLPPPLFRAPLLD